MTDSERIEILENEVKVLEMHLAHLCQIIQRLQKSVWNPYNDIFKHVNVEQEIHKIKIPGGFTEV